MTKSMTRVGTSTLAPCASSGNMGLRPTWRLPPPSGRTQAPASRGISQPVPPANLKFVPTPLAGRRRSDSRPRSGDSSVSLRLIAHPSSRASFRASISSESCSANPSPGRATLARIRPFAAAGSRRSRLRLRSSVFPRIEAVFGALRLVGVTVLIAACALLSVFGSVHEQPEHDHPPGGHHEHDHLPGGHHEHDCTFACVVEQLVSTTQPTPRVRPIVHQVLRDTAPRERVTTRRIAIHHRSPRGPPA